MRIAILSDIHGNLPALDAVLTDLAHETIDQIVCLGDVAIFGPQPCTTLARVLELGCPVVMGNTDAWALNPSPHPVRDEEPAFFNAVKLWGAKQLSAQDLAFIRTFQPTIYLELGDGVTFLGFHGSPNSFNDVITATTSDDEIAAMFAGHRATVMAGGHTHTPLVRRYQGTLIVNPGSIGLPWMQLVDTDATVNPAWAEYTIVTVDEGRTGVELRRTSYDLETLRTVVLTSGMPHGEWWLGDWVNG